MQGGNISISREYCLSGILNLHRRIEAYEESLPTNLYRQEGAKSMTLTSFRVSKRPSTVSNLVKHSKYGYRVPDYFVFRLFARHVAVVPASEGF